MKVRELLTDESKWCRGDYAKDANGTRVMEHSQEAFSWCLVGAVRKCYWRINPFGYESGTSAYYDILNRLSKEVPDGYITEWNDRATFEQVKALVEELDI